ncbi:MAG TPA: hypothetical protein VMA55_22605 [Acidovorax sp.]|nr:hypothetical protein [Acidovorax sp.]
MKSCARLQFGINDLFALRPIRYTRSLQLATPALGVLHANTITLAQRIGHALAAGATRTGCAKLAPLLLSPPNFIWISVNASAEVFHFLFRHGRQTMPSPDADLMNE